MLCEEKRGRNMKIRNRLCLLQTLMPTSLPAINNSGTKPVIKHLLLTDAKIAVNTPGKHQQKVVLEKYWGSNYDQCFEQSHSQVQRLLLASESKVSLTYLLWVLVLRRGQQLQWYSHFCLIRCLGMLMWKWNLILQKSLATAAPERRDTQFAF